MGDRPSQPVTITDDRGVERPLWHFPKSEDGVPPDCPIPAREQRDIERSLGAPEEDSTPAAPNLRERIVYGLAFTVWALVLPVIGGPLRVSWSMTLPFAALFVLTLIPLGASLKAAQVWIGRTLTVGLLASMTLAGVFWLTRSLATLPVALIVLWCAGLIALHRLQAIARCKRDRRRSVEDARRELIAAGRCPSCAYPLAGLEREADQCVVCSHCGGAWRVGIVRPWQDPTHCTTCGYALAGLTPSPNRTVRCPECSQVIPLTASVPAAPPHRASCPTCGGFLPCPHCDQSRSGLTEADLNPTAPAQPRDA